MIYRQSDVKNEAMKSSSAETYGFHRMLSEKLGLKHLFFSIETLPAGKASSAAHRHTEKEEAFYVISGHPTVIVGDKEEQASPGDLIAFIPGGKDFHCIRNDSDQPCQMVVASAGHKTDQTTFQ